VFCLQTSTKIVGLMNESENEKFHLDLDQRNQYSSLRSYLLTSGLTLMLVLMRFFDLDH
jgi:hypothetical protein